MTALATAMVLNANADSALQKVTAINLTGYYQSGSSYSSTTNKSAGTVTWNESSTVTQFKITQDDIWNAYGKKANTTNYLIYTNFYQYSPIDYTGGYVYQVQLVSGSNTPIPVLTISDPVSVYSSTWSSTQKTNGTSGSSKGKQTSYTSLGASLPTNVFWGGITNGATVTPKVTSLSLHGVGTTTLNSSGSWTYSTTAGSVDKNTSTTSTSLSFIGSGTLLLPHSKTNSSPGSATFVITSGSVTAK